MYYFLAYFLIFSFLGWCSEVIYSAYKRGKFVNRGFLDGPVCPIYGTGVAFLFLITQKIGDKDGYILLLSFALPTLIELVTGFLLEKIFHHKWWDYSDQPHNFHGYICPKFSLIWGLACISVIKILFPFFNRILDLLPYRLFYTVWLALAGVMLADAVCSLTAVIGLNKRLRALDSVNEKLHESSDKIGEKVYEGAVKMQETVESLQETKNKLLAKLKKFHTHKLRAVVKEKDRFISIDEAMEQRKK